MGEAQIHNRDTEHFLYRGIHRNQETVGHLTMGAYLRSLETREDIDLPVEVWRTFNRALERGLVFRTDLHCDYTAWDLANECRFTQAFRELPTEHWYGQLADMIGFCVEQPYGEEGSLVLDRGNYFQLQSDYLGLVAGNPKMGIWEVRLIPSRSLYDEFCLGGDRFFEAIPK